MILLKKADSFNTVPVSPLFLFQTKHLKKDNYTDLQPNFLDRKLYSQFQETFLNS